MTLVLSLFPGIGMLDHGFEEEGFTIVRGPDLLWGGDIAGFRPPPGVFEGVIGGPPCQGFSPIGNVNRARYGASSVAPDLIPEFERVVCEAAPQWWVMENSVHAYAPLTDGEEVFATYLDASWLGQEQARKRAFWSNLPLFKHLAMPALVPPGSGSERAVSSKESVDWQGSRAREGPRSLDRVCELQGLPPDFLADTPFAVKAARKMIANGVPIPMARAVARAVKKAIGAEEGA